MTPIEQTRALLTQAVAAAQPIWDLGDGRGSFLVDELNKALAAAGLTKARKVKPIGKGVARFEEFWSAYPARRINKAACMKKWANEELDDVADEIVAHVQKNAASADWRKEDGKYVPMTTTYLNQRRWEDGTVQSEAWVKAAGFADRYAAENAGCRPGTAHKYRNGARA